MAKLYVAAKKADFNGIGQRFSISPVLARVIRNRDNYHCRNHRNCQQC